MLRWSRKSVRKFVARSYVHTKVRPMREGNDPSEGGYVSGTGIQTSEEPDAHGTNRFPPYNVFRGRDITGSSMDQMSSALCTTPGMFLPIPQKLKQGEYRHRLFYRMFSKRRPDFLREDIPSMSLSQELQLDGACVSNVATIYRSHFGPGAGSGENIA